MEKFGLGKKPAPAAETATQAPDETVLDLLEMKAREVAAKNPEIAGKLENSDYRLIATYASNMRAKEGTPYTEAELQQAGEALEEHLRNFTQDRLEAKESATSAYRVVGPDRFVVGQVNSKGEVGELAEEGRA